MATEVTSPAVTRKASATTLAPYRATKLWNDVIASFCAGLPLGRHRRYMKSYDQTFTGSEAIAWLHRHLQEDENFGPSVTRNQTIKLLQKLQKANVFEDVRGLKAGHELFSDGGRLYRLVPTTPVKQRLEKCTSKDETIARAPLSSISDIMNTTRRSMRLPKKSAPPAAKHGLHERALSEGHLASGATCRPSTADVEAVWKKMTLSELQRVLKLSNLNEILDVRSVSAANIIHNMTQVNRNGIVTNISKQDQLPHWVISAMRCLAYWPEKVEEHLPDYPGFQNEVFRIIKDYFDSLEEPLVPFDMFDVFINVVANVRGLRQPRGSKSCSSSESSTRVAKTMNSVENLIMDMTMDAARCYDSDADVLTGTSPSSGSSDVRVFPRYESSVDTPFGSCPQFNAPVTSTYVCDSAREWGSGPPPYRPPPSYPAPGGLRSSGGVAISTCNLTESYRQAIEPATTPTGKSLYAGLRRSHSSPSLLPEVSRFRVLQALRLCCLLLPPADRRKLHLLLRLMHKMVNNRRLVMDGHCTRALVLNEMTSCILRPPDLDECVADDDDAASRSLALRIVEIMMDNYAELMAVPADLRDQIEDRIVWLRKSPKVAGLETDTANKVVFCEQLTVRQYERQRLSASQCALQDLLNEIISDAELSVRSKRKHLKQFQKNYPEIYAHRFPSGGILAESSSGSRHRNKQQLLSKPLQKLRILRL